MLDTDSVFSRTRLPFGLQALLITKVFASPRLMPDVLRPTPPVQSVPQKLFLDVLAPARERHHLLSRVAPQFPPAVRTRDVDPIAEVFDRVRKLGSIDRAGKGLGPIDLYWIEASPRRVGSPSHVRDNDVS